MSALEIGHDSPSFRLPEAGGDEVSSEALKGHPYVLYFYPKDDTSGCTLEAIQFSALEAEFAGIDVPVLGVSPDPIKQHCKFRDKHALKVKLLSDEEKSLIGAYGLWVEKSMYGRTYMGVERTTVLVDGDGRIARVWPKVKVEGHADEVLAAARELAAAS